MNQAEIHQFLINFFSKRQAEIIRDDEGLLEVKLTEKLDQQLMNRPFYWQYVKKLGYEGEPMTVTFISNESKKGEKGEWIHFGSPRLEQLFQIILDEGKYAELYENISVGNQRAPLYPWFISNFIVKYHGAYVHDELISVGVLLTNGTMRFRLMDDIKQYDFIDTPPNYCYKIPQIISPQRANQLIELEIKERIRQKAKNFEQLSLKIYEEELNLLNELLQSREEDDEDLQLIKKNNEEQIYNRLYPKVSFVVINSGLFYLSQQLTQKLTTF